MGIGGPTLSQSLKWLFLLTWLKACLKKMAFAKFLSQLCELAFFGKTLALSNKKSTFAFLSDFFGCCISTILSKCYLKSFFFIKKAP